MQNSNGKFNQNNNNAVCVAVRIRPQNARERAENASICLAVTPGEPQITIGRDKAFTYDHVFEEHTKQQDIYNSCISGLLEGAFEGYNATVLAYGQTGSGKTYTMGTSFDATQIGQHSVEHLAGIIPRAAQHIFDGISLRKENAIEAGHLEPSFEVFVQFIELYNEEIIDLLAEGPRNGAIKIQEDAIRNEINLRGTVWQPVQSAQDVMDALKAGAMNRTTAATNMNQQSSRSHAIFTVQLKQSRVVPVEANDEDGTGQPSTELEVLHAKFHFVDLAGSERLKRTGATGDRAKEGISINSGLLALGNVISALGGGNGGGGRTIHVPYRDSKLTRLLQDSLGGNSRTLMIACASPSDVDFVETLNTLHYANRAKNIKNRVVANQDKSSKLITEMRCRIVALEAELQEYKQGKRLIGEDGEEMINDQYLENQQLQVENQRMRVRIKGLDETIEILRTRSVELQKELEMAKLRAGIVAGMLENKENGGAEAIGEQQFSAMIEGYLQEMETLKTKLIEVNSTNEALRKQNHHFRQQLEQQGMAASSFTGSPYMPMTSSGIGASQNSLIKSARAEIERQKKALLAASPREEEADAENPAIDEEENEGDDDEMALLAEDVDDEDDEEQENSQEHMRLYGEVAQLQEDINLKERLVQELEASQRKIEQMRQNYEKKLGELSNRIQTTESERDNILSEMAAKKPSQKQKEEINKVREKYEKELANMRSEHRRLELAEKQNKKMQLQQSRQQSECERIKQELETLKRQKVDLMKQLKDEAKRIREIQSTNAKKTATLEKLQRQQQNKIIRLERETAMKTEYLKRKAEEIQRIKAQQKRRETIIQSNQQNRRGGPNKSTINVQEKAADTSTSIADATFLVESPHFPLPQLLNLDEDASLEELEEVTMLESKTPRTTTFQTPKMMKNGSIKNKRHSQTPFPAIQHTPIRTKRQWSAMERAIECLVNRKNAVAFEEQAMNRLIKERHCLQEQLARLSAQSACTMDLKLRADILEEQDALQTKLNYIQCEILKYQKNIVELEDQIVEFEPINRRSSQMLVGIPTLEEQTSVDNIDSLVLRFSREFHIPSEAQYILRNLLDAVVQKGTELAKVQADNKELTTLLGLDTNEDVREVMEARRQQQQFGMPSSNETLQPRSSPRLDPLFETTFMVPPNEKEMNYKDTNYQYQLSTSSAGLEQSQQESSSSGITSAGCDRSEFSKWYSPKMESNSLISKMGQTSGHTKDIICIHANEERMISGSKDRTAVIWDLEKNESLMTLFNHPNNVVFAQLSNDGNLAYTVALNIVKVWDLRAPDSERCVYHLSSMGQVESGENGPSPRIQPEQLHYTETPICAAAIEPISQRYLFTTCKEYVRVWDLQQWTHLGTIRDVQCKNPIEKLAVIPSTQQGNAFHVGILPKRAKQIGLYQNVSIENGQIRADPALTIDPNHDRSITAFCLTKNALYTTAKHKNIMRYSLLDLKRDHVEPMAHNEETITQMCSVPSSIPNAPPSMLVTGCRGGIVKLWDVASSNRMHQIGTFSPVNPPTEINALSANRQLIFIANSDSVLIWRIQQQQGQ